MLKNAAPIWIAAALVFALQVTLVRPGVPPIVNMHESVESLEDATKLQIIMEDLGMEGVVLSAIPEAFLYFSDDTQLSLTDVEESNALVQKFAEENPDFDFLCTLDPLDLNRVQVLQDCLEAGAVGLKLYNGYSYSHVLPIDDPRLSELYTALQESGMPLLLPVNAGEFRVELENMLVTFPDLEVVCSHYCLSSKSLSRLSELMTAHPNLYVDTSFGSTAFALEGFQTMSENKAAFQEFFLTFEDRILFGTNNVVTTYEGKDEAFLTDLYQNYISAIEDLDLPYATQQKVFWRNWTNLLK